MSVQARDIIEQIRTMEAVGRLAWQADAPALCEAWESLQNEEKQSEQIPPFQYLRELYALDRADSLTVAAAAVRAHGVGAGRDLYSLWRDLGGRELPACFSTEGGALHLFESVLDFLYNRMPRLPKGAALHLSKQAPLYHSGRLDEQLCAFVEKAAQGGLSVPVAVVLSGPSGSGRKFLFARAAQALGYALLILEKNVSPADVGELIVAARLYGALPCIEDYTGDAALPLALSDAVELLFVTAPEDFTGIISGWTAVCRRVEPLTAQERHTALLSEIGEADDMTAWADRPLSMKDIIELSRAIPVQKLFGGEMSAPVGAVPFGCTPLVTDKRLKDIVLTQEQAQRLQRLCTFARQRSRVYDSWGLSKKIPYGKGLSALFYGASGTGKTLAASAVANELGLPCYRADLSSIVSKYIGETQKNIGRIFEEAGRAECVLFFDEADALFSRRSDGQDAQEQYRNGEIAYLLQRMEGYDGLVLLATNLFQNFDEAFRRRISQMILFPMPDAALRQRLWRELLPEGAPVGVIDWEALASFELSGAGIKNCVLYAAMLAASEKGKIDTARLMLAVEEEYSKSGKQLPLGRFYRKG